MEGLRWVSGGPNPHCNQTNRGLYLELYYGQPTKLWTPWGEWHFADANEHIDVNALMGRLTTSEHIAEVFKLDTGVIGPVYALLAIDGIELPEPELPTDGRQCLEYKDAKEAWERLVE